MKVTKYSELMQMYIRFARSDMLFYLYSAFKFVVSDNHPPE